MVRQIKLTKSNSDKVDELSRQTGKTPDEVVNEAVDGLKSGLPSARESDWKSAWKQAAGMWKDRTDLPDYRELRQSWDERLERLK